MTFDPAELNEKFWMRSSAHQRHYRKSEWEGPNEKVWMRSASDSLGCLGWPAKRNHFQFYFWLGGIFLFSKEIEWSKSILHSFNPKSCLISVHSEFLIQGFLFRTFYSEVWDHGEEKIFVGCPLQSYERTFPSLLYSQLEGMRHEVKLSTCWSKKTHLEVWKRLELRIVGGMMFLEICPKMLPTNCNSRLSGKTNKKKAF